MMKKKRKQPACWQKLKQKVAAVAVADAGRVAAEAVVVVTSKGAVRRVVVIADPVVDADNPTTLFDSRSFSEGYKASSDDDFILTFKYSNNYVNCCYYSR
jgi:dTDP-4-dehydrorhamnose 3,5-epimerase-like enzyme